MADNVNKWRLRSGRLKIEYNSCFLWFTKELSPISRILNLIRQHKPNDCYAIKIHLTNFLRQIRKI